MPIIAAGLRRAAPLAAIFRHKTQEMQMQTGTTPLPEVASLAGISTDKARHWVEALGYTLMKVGRCRHVPPEAVPQVREMARLVAGGISPQVAAATLKTVPVVEPQPTIAPKFPLTLDLAAQVEGMRRAMLEMTTAFRDEAAAIRATVERQAEEIRNLRTVLLPPPAPSIQTRKIEPWKSEPGPDPAEEMPWWRVAWLSLVDPAKLRRWDSA